MKPSTEIFEAYAKLAKEQGLITKTAESNNPRYDSQDLSALEMLYGVKPNGKDEKHIMEQAHPDPMIIAPAYDRINGLVENELERQNMSVFIATKPTSGSLTGQRYVKAHQELTNEVIKLGFFLDKNNEEELMSLADSCTEVLTKEAIAPLLIVGLIAGAIALVKGISYLEDNPESKNLVTDIKTAKQELTDAQEQYPKLMSILSPFIERLNLLEQANSEYEAYRSEIKTVLVNVSTTSTIEEKRKMIASNAAKLFTSGYDQKIVKSITELKAQANAIINGAPIVMEELNSAQSKFNEGSFMGEWADTVKDWWHKYVWNSETEDAVKSIANVVKSAGASATGAGELLASLENLRHQVQSAPDNQEQVNKEHVDTNKSKPVDPMKLPEWA
jgi:hypothetical protein